MIIDSTKTRTELSIDTVINLRKLIRRRMKLVTAAYLAGEELKFFKGRPVITVNMTKHMECPYPKWVD